MIHFVLDQHAALDLNKNSASSLKQQSRVDMSHHLDTCHYPDSDPSNLCSHSLIFSLTEPESQTYDLGEHANYYTTDAIGFSCCVLFLFCVLRLVHVYPMVPVSLDCPLLIASSVFSNVYLNHLVICNMSTTVDVHFVDCVHEYSTSTGSLTSKNYPGPYDSNTDCLYIVKPPSGSLYSLKVDVFQMADNGDFLEVFIL
jgi:hypothetical protein